MPMEIWKTIDGYFWRYRINDMARVEREKKPGEWIPVKPFIYRDKKHHNSSGRLAIRMKTVDGQWMNIFVKNLMIDAFFGGRKPGDVFIHRNGFFQDCSIYNLIRTTEQKVGERTGGAGRKSIEKIDSDGNVLDLYSSVTEAAEKNFVSRKFVSNRCGKRVKNPFALTGFSFRYEK